MKTSRKFKSTIVLALLAAACMFLGAGCHTPDPENASSRPWNSPKGWENGLPVGLTEGR